MLLGWLKTNNKRFFSVLFIASFSVLATQDSDQMPDMALLEYLAELVEVDGELIGPMDMEDNIHEDMSNKEPSQALDNQKEPSQTKESQTEGKRENETQQSPDNDKAAKTLSKDDKPTTQEQ